jgi:hypothetical protein
MIGTENAKRKKPIESELVSANPYSVLVVTPTVPQSTADIMTSINPRRASARWGVDVFTESLHNLKKPNQTTGK